MLFLKGTIRSTSQRLSIAPRNSPLLSIREIVHNGCLMLFLYTCRGMAAVLPRGMYGFPHLNVFTHGNQVDTSKM